MLGPRLVSGFVSRYTTRPLIAKGEKINVNSHFRIQIAAAVLAAVVAAAPTSPRTVVPFDFGWRHRLLPPGAGAPGPPENPPEADPNFPDGGWGRVRLPHDGLIALGASNASCPAGCSGKSFIPRREMWYRKAFTLPPGWTSPRGAERGGSVWLEMDGVFHACVVYLNGVVVARNAEGYLGFRVPLENATAGRNVIAVFVDPDGGAGFSPLCRTGWWYEGAGIYRHSRLVRTALLQIGRDGLVARSSIEWRGNSAKSAVLTASATIVNTAAGSVTAGARVVFQLVEGSTGAVAGAVSSAKLPAVASAGSVTASGAIELASPRLWTAQSPALYTVVAELRRGDAVIDAVNVSHGFRDLAFTGADGAPSCTLNRRPFKWRGFCDHSNFAVVGSAVPDRIKLFRSMMSRAVGGNARRTSHNPPDPTMLDIYDRTGTLVMDETRVFNALNSSVDAMAALVRRDRNHPSVGMWSFCNEEACEANGAGPGDPQLGAPLFAAAVRTEDGTRPTAANTPGWHGPFPPYIPTDLLTRNIDIQGFSHAGMQQGDSDAHLDGNPALGKAPNTPAIFHNMTRYRTKPIFGSECCSCNTMRDEDVGCESSNGQDRCIQKSFSADCAQEQSEIYDNAPFVVGTMVWTLFDYLGEPSGTWPNVISSFGQFDVAGFPKAQATWYRAKWLLRSDDGRADKPFRTGNRSVVHLVESWEKPRPTPPIKWSCNRTAFRALCARPKSECEDCVLKHAADMVRFGCSANEWDYLCRTGGAAPPAPPPSPPNSKDVTVYSAAASVELVVNGVSLGIRQLPTQRRTENATVVRTWAEWANVRWAPGNATVIGRDATGEVVAVSTRFTSGAAARIVLSLDAPSARTGTGVALLADGQDTALVRATVVDAAGHKVHDASNVITFSVRSGDGRLVGTHNGRVDSHARSDSDAVPAYHGLARAVVSVTSAAALPQAQRTLLAQIDADSDLTGLDGRLSSDTIVVEASSPGIPSALLSIPVSTAPEHGVLAVAAAAAGNPISF